MCKKKEPIKIICHNCGSEFFVLPWRKHKAKYCCRKCLNEVQGKSMVEYHKTHNPRTIKKVCKNHFCKKEFIVTSKGLDRKFCCTECFRYSTSLEYKERRKKEKIVKNITTINKIWSL